MIELKNISRIYHNKNGDFIALENISYNFNNNGMYGILGPSGAGKSTLIGIMGLIDFPTFGEVYIDNQLINKDNFVKIRKDYLSFIFQENNLINNYSVIDNLHLISNDDTKINELLEMVKLTDTKNAYISELSGGEIQRIAFIRTILEDKPILLCDEPTGSLDSNNRTLLMNLLKNISKNKLVIIVSHNQEQTKYYSDVIIEIDNHSFKNITGHPIQNSKLNTNLITKPLNKSIIIKNELKYKPLKNILHLFLFLLIGILITISSNAVYYNERDGAKFNSVKNDVIEVYKEIKNNNQIFNISSGKKINELIKKQIPVSNRQEAFFANDISFVFNDTKDLKNNEIILTNDYSYYIGSEKKIFQIGDTLSFSPDLNYIVKGYTTDRCNYINSSSKEKFYEFKRKYIQFTLPLKNDNGSIHLSNDGSLFSLSSSNLKYLRPSSDINIVLQENEVIYNSEFGENYKIPDLNKADQNGYLTDSFINLSDYYNDTINILNINHSFGNQNPNMNNYDKHCFYVSSEVYQRIQKTIDQMDLTQYVFYNDKDIVIDFIYDNDLDVKSNFYKDKAQSRLYNYVNNSGNNSGLHFITIIFKILYVILNIVLIFVAAYLIRNKVRTRKNIIGLLDLRGIKRLISTIIVNIDTILILTINFLICFGLSFVDEIIYVINSLLNNTGINMNYFYPSLVDTSTIIITMTLIIIASVLIGTLLIRKTTTKEIFKIKE
ncbi:MAG: ATP-binding cassette domain-containing protein [Bacilli bacterium]